MKQLHSVGNNCSRAAEDQSAASWMFSGTAPLVVLFLVYPLKVLPDILLHHLDHSGVFFWLDDLIFLTCYLLLIRLPYFSHPPSPERLPKTSFRKLLRVAEETKD